MTGPLIIAVDFDGTICEHEYPEIGPPIPGAIETLLEMQEKFSAKIILWTMRSDGRQKNGEISDVLAPAVAILKARGVKLWGINENPEQTWSASPKAYAHVYVDDAALGCPMIPGATGKRPMVDWTIVRLRLLALATGEQ